MPATGCATASLAKRCGERWGCPRRQPTTWRRPPDRREAAQHLACCSERLGRWVSASPWVKLGVSYPRACCSAGR